MLLELSITLLKNIYSAVFTYNHNLQLSFTIVKYLKSRSMEDNGEIESSSVTTIDLSLNRLIY